MVGIGIECLLERLFYYGSDDELKTYRTTNGVPKAITVIGFADGEIWETNSWLEDASLPLAKHRLSKPETPQRNLNLCMGLLNL